MRRIVSVTALMALTAGLPAAAQAEHGKVGLWKVSVSIDDPALAKASDKDRAEIKAQGMDMTGGNTLVAGHCMTAAEVAAPTLPATRQAPGCSLQNLAGKGQTFTGELVCTQEPKGRGTLAITYDRPDHYAGEMRFTGSSAGQPVHLTYRYAGQWIGADCGAAKH